ncbi:target of Myb1 membrane trafficking protein isoform X6 [Pezoporus wallicus]|uniref:target of Myb1 membrane trafficking protein isoform X6 n=1 Tax=Pezoporus wallicus TaxID=35540 RepID=UPI00254F011E|nr:target of Myb1 membrane trafficking protein isoform X6 [Pezoporus wallicus]
MSPLRKPRFPLSGHQVKSMHSLFAFLPEKQTCGLTSAGLRELPMGPCGARTGLSTWRSATSLTRLKKGKGAGAHPAAGPSTSCSIASLDCSGSIHWWRPKDAFRAIKKRIVGNKNFHEVMLALTVLETCVKNCGHRFHVLVSSQDFVEGVLVRTILPKNNPPAIVHDKVLTLIQSWADAFRSSPDLTGVVAVYEDLRRKGLEFPMTDLDMLSPIHTPQRTVYSSDSQSGQNSPVVNSPQQIESILHPVTLPAGRSTSSDAPITPTPEQVGKLRSELEVVNGNMKVMSEMLTELVPTQAEPSDLELLQELNRTCRAMQLRVLELIPRVLHEQLTEELLLINDNLNNMFLRHERFERLRTGQPVKAPNEAENSLIDLGPSTPSAVRQPEVTNNLSSQLAGMR